MRLTINYSGQETHNNVGNPESYLRKAEDVATNMLAKGYIFGKEHRSEQKSLMRNTSLVLSRQQNLEPQWFGASCVRSLLRLESLMRLKSLSSRASHASETSCV
ncbi:hypothetical protein Fmac_005731 [Flemingia macrophylla]|uniref:Uncharacterized protein n=1 Tax=Flemingia macrophylla TaxID=520843 RepID=A0ABD1N931_9FABA